MKNTNLYFIRDRIAKVPESTIIQVQNDLVAMRGFMDFCKKDGISPAEHELVHIAELTEDNEVFNSNCYVVCNGDNAESIYKERCSSVLSDVED